MIPKIEISTWSHGNKKLVFTVNQPVEVEITPEDLIKAISHDTCSNVLSEILNKTADMYSSHDGRFSMPYAVDYLTDDAKEFIHDMYESIKEAEQ